MNDKWKNTCKGAAGCLLILIDVLLAFSMPLLIVIGGLRILQRFGVI